MLAVAQLRLTSAALDHRAFLTSSNQASRAAFSAVWSLCPLRASTNSRKVRRAMTRILQDYHAPKVGASSTQRYFARVPDAEAHEAFAVNGAKAATQSRRRIWFTRRGADQVLPVPYRRNVPRSAPGPLGPGRPVRFLGFSRQATPCRTAQKGCDTPQRGSAAS